MDIECFNSRARVGRDRTPRAPRLSGGLFQFTRPRGARRQRQPWVRLRASFNSRARVGRDNCEPPLLDHRSRFNSRARVGRDVHARDPHAGEGLVSIHAPAWGATPFRGCPNGASSGFNSRARVGRDGPRPLPARGWKVSIHAPAWGATLLGRDPLRVLRVSIHAPAWGATLASGERARKSATFQFTRPRGARLGRWRSLGPGRIVSIHAPAWGATP